MSSSDAKASGEQTPTTVRRFMGVLRPYAGWLAIAVVFLLALAAVNMAVPALIAVLFNRVFEEGKPKEEAWALLWLVLGGILGVYVLKNMLYFASKYTVVYVGEQLAFNLRKRLFERLQTRSLEFYRRQNPGRISSRVMDDSFTVQSFIQDVLPKTLQSACLFVGLVITIYLINWKLALVSTFVLPLHLLTFQRFSRPIKQAGKTAAEQLAHVQGNLIEKFLGMEVVKGFAAEQRENDAFVRAISLSRRSQLRSKIFHVGQKIVADLLVGLGTVGLLGFGGYQVINGEMRPGTFIAFFSYIGMLFPAVLQLMSSFAKMTKASAGVDRISEMLEGREAESTEKGLVIPISGHLRFEGVRFQYADGPPLLKHIDLEIPAGTVCAITGRSGGGKSTFVSLVPRFFDPDEGVVCIDNTDVRALDLRHLRESVGMAFQDPFLFNASIFENLRYAKPEATFNQIREAAKRTGAEGFITGLDDGYATRVGENGVSLSRGEKQRLALTRSLLKNPRILILDEATSSLDADSELEILRSVFAFMKGKTTMVVTHRTELLREADMVVTLDNGRVTYAGPPERMPASTPVETPADRPPLHAAKATVLAAVVAGVGLLSSGAPAAGGEAKAKQGEKPTAVQIDADAIPESARFVSKSGVRSREAHDIVEIIKSRLRAKKGYKKASENLASELPPPPVDLTEIHTVAADEKGGVRVLQFGYRAFQTQPLHFWVAGRRLTDGGNQANPDVKVAVKLLGKASKQLKAEAKKLAVEDLSTATVPLSYISPKQCLTLLQTFGYTTIKPGASVDPSKLPVVMRMPKAGSTEIVQGMEITQGSSGPSIIPGRAKPIKEQTTATPVTQVMVFYHPARPEQLSRVLNLIRSKIDRPARQILIEAMVLEVSEQGVDKLGVQWDLQTPEGNLGDLKIGRLPEFSQSAPATLDAEFSDVFGEFGVRLKALIRENKAQILSRPSVLALNGRQAAIRVGEEIPVANTLKGVFGGGNIQLNFNYIPVGIVLNVRPRVSADGKHISMQVDGIVSATVPGKTRVVKDNRGNVLGRAPQISTRRVQTQTRIANNTPFIIGGLISEDDVREISKVPILGDTPLIRYLFRSVRIETLKREVIIVITPVVLPRDQTVGRNLPKDSKLFDSFGHKLFRDAYRIRAEDVFDLSFLRRSDYLQTMRRKANAVVQGNFRFADRYPFSEFTGDHVPGEEILVHRQMYEVIKRLELAQKVNREKIIFFERAPSAPSGFDVAFLMDFLRQKVKEETGRALPDNASPKKIFEALGNQGLVLEYASGSGGEIGAVLDKPVPEIRMVECGSRDAWADHLARLNDATVPGGGEEQTFSIVLHAPADLVRLKRALLLERTIRLNGGRKELTLDNFTIGRQMLIPESGRDAVHLIGRRAARAFYYTEQYYAAFKEKLTRALGRLRKALQQPEVQQYLGDGNLPPRPKSIENLLGAELSRRAAEPAVVPRDGEQGGKPRRQGDRQRRERAPEPQPNDGAAAAGGAEQPGRVQSTGRFQGKPYVVFDLGSDWGLEKGATVALMDGSTRVATAEVTVVRADSAVARVTDRNKDVRKGLQVEVRKAPSDGEQG